MSAHSETEASFAEAIAVDPTVPCTEEELNSQIIEATNRIEALNLENNTNYNEAQRITYLPGITPFPEHLLNQEPTYFDEDGLDWRADDYPVERMLRFASIIFTPAHGFNPEAFKASMKDYIADLPSLPLLPPSPGYETQELPYVDELPETCTGMERLSLTDVQMSD